MWGERENFTPLRNETNEPFSSLIDMSWLMLALNVDNEDESKAKYYY
jgi:hypothetical protein